MAQGHRRVSQMQKAKTSHSETHRERKQGQGADPALGPSRFRDHGDGPFRGHSHRGSRDQRIPQEIPQFRSRIRLVAQTYPQQILLARCGIQTKGCDYCRAASGHLSP